VPVQSIKKGKLMPQSREDKIRLAYTAIKKKVIREGLDRAHERTLLAVAEAFALSPLKINQIVRK
jgi:hypothetical protein